MRYPFIKFFTWLFGNPTVRNEMPTPPPGPFILPYITYAEYDIEKGLLKTQWSNGVERTFKGSCAVWRKYPMMERCSTSLESRLCNIWEYIVEHGNPYPTAHAST